MTGTAEKLLREALPRLGHLATCRYLPAMTACTCGYVALENRIAAHLSAHPVTGEGDGCTRSHPHEDMSEECERLTVEAKAANQRRNKEVGNA